MVEIEVESRRSYDGPLTQHQSRVLNVALGRVYSPQPSPPLLDRSPSPHPGINPHRYKTLKSANAGQGTVEQGLSHDSI